MICTSECVGFTQYLKCYYKWQISFNHFTWTCLMRYCKKFSDKEEVYFHAQETPTTLSIHRQLPEAPDRSRLQLGICARFASPVLWLLSAADVQRQLVHLQHSGAQPLTASLEDLDALGFGRLSAVLFRKQFPVHLGVQLVPASVALWRGGKYEICWHCKAQVNLQTLFCEAFRLEIAAQCWPAPALLPGCWWSETPGYATASLWPCTPPGSWSR